MAELPDLGKHCQQIDPELGRLCNQLDYCPFYCMHCEKWSCSNHRWHGCEKKNSRVVTEPVKKKGSRCPYRRCKNNLVMSYKCNECGVTYCMSHRHHFDHAKNSTNSKTKNSTNSNNKMNNIIHTLREEKKDAQKVKYTTGGRAEFYGGNQIYVKEGKKRLCPLVEKGIV